MTLLRRLAPALLLIVFFGAGLHLPGQTAPAPASADPGFSIDQMDTTLRFAADGTGDRTRTLRARIESDAAVRELGVLAFSYDADIERLEISYVRVRKADGSVVETPQSNIQEAASPAALSAPMYSDVRVKQIPVKALANGDSLEYQIRWVETKPTIPNQFWYEHDFTAEAEVREETLTIRVPSDKYVRLSSPTLAPQTREENGEKVYSWKTSHKLSADKASAKGTKKKDDEAPAHSVELTTFRNWEEVGKWYGDLARDKVAVTPEIQAKADELIKGLTSRESKERALYDFVSTKFRYISISFGEGRYQPHTAAEVLANLYGDCKDKHTLLASLLKAEGIEASAALIGSGLPFNAEVPSPAQFNHVITMIPSAAGDVWVDATPEVAPFGMLEKDLRGHEALVVPVSGAAKVVKTPAGAVRNSEVVHFKGSLDGDGTLLGHFDYTLQGDAELLLRAVFHETQPTRWTDLAQEMAANMGFAGTVSAVDIDNPQDTSKPFHFAWDYKREKYPDWANLQIIPPFPPMALQDPPADSSDDIELGDAGELDFDATIKLPSGYAVEIPGAVHRTTPFAEFQASFEMTDAGLVARRKLATLKDKVTQSDRKAYMDFVTATNFDLERVITLAKTQAGIGVTAAESNPQARDLIGQAFRSLVNEHNTNAAREALRQAETLNPKQEGLWATWSMLYDYSKDEKNAIESIRKEIAIYPGEVQAYRALAAMEIRYHHPADAEAALKEMLTIVPDDDAGLEQLTTLLIADKSYDDALKRLDNVRRDWPGKASVETLRIHVLLSAGRKDEGVAAARGLSSDKPNAAQLNSVAYWLADAGAELKLADDYAGQSIAMLEDSLKSVHLDDLNGEKMQSVVSLAGAWDTEGWISFLTGDLPKAEKMVDAAWMLAQHGVVADHLSRIYEKEGKKDDAVRLAQLSLATSDKPAGASEHLQKLVPPKTVQMKATQTSLEKTVTVTAAAASPGELSKLWTVMVPEFSRSKGSAEFFVLFSAKGVEDVSFISGDEDLRGAKDAIAKAKFDEPFGDDGPEKIVRHAILSCSQYTHPNCQMVLLQPGMVTYKAQ